MFASDITGNITAILGDGTGQVVHEFCGYLSFLLLVYIQKIIAHFFYIAIVGISYYYWFDVKIKN